MGKHAGNIEHWAQARGKHKRGAGWSPKHARAGRHAAVPIGYRARQVMRGQSFYGWTRESLVNAARMA